MPVDTIGASGADYTTQGGWEAALDGDLSSTTAPFDGATAFGQCFSENFDNAGQIELAGATSNGVDPPTAALHRELEADAGAEFDPLTGTGARMIQTADSRVLRLQEQFTRASFLGIELSGAWNREVVRPVGSNSILQSCFMRSTQTNVTTFGDCYLRGAGTDHQVRSCIAVGNGAGNGDGFLGGGNQVFHNCVAYNCVTGFGNASGDVITNCAGVSCTTEGFGGAGTYLTNWSTDTTGGGQTSQAEAQFLDPTNDDFRLDGDESPNNAEDGGTDLSGTFTGSFVAGVDHGDASASWNIGAYDGAVTAGGGGMLALRDTVLSGGMESMTGGLRQ